MAITQQYRPSLEQVHYPTLATYTFLLMLKHIIFQQIIAQMTVHQQYNH